ncbi:NUDIX domain-containing protein [Bacillus sp. FJAT-49736]|uniref:NUDIX hydrolase n=1 Tax=Bacillus sp. FJAT-49736 TaxID=2833582 RepID=UPI001BC9CC74|nr:NUDIX domain-containing protein [Bacillus sp. FJAT-49736]MBS4172819.1 NUDIX domain-containing protein [Bacillus sp. FJAT-49736]
MYPRANTLGILIHNNQILLEEQYGIHSRGTGTFYRPIGGTIELGERSEEALVREYKEEIQADIFVIQYLTCIENIYKIEENIGHEITQIHLVEFKDKGLYERDSFLVTEGDKITKAVWISIKDVLNSDMIVYPNGLQELLEEVIF